MNEMSDEEVTSAPNHLLWTEGEDGMTHFKVGCTWGCLLTILTVIGIIILLVVLRRHGVI